MADRQRFFSRTCFYLWLAAVLGAICVLPYAMALTPGGLGNAAQRVGIPIPAIIAISTIQSAVILSVMTFAGLWAARKLGLGAPLVDALIYKEVLAHDVHQNGTRAIALGVAAAFLIIGLDLLVFGPILGYFDKESQLSVALWKGFLASFYGGISEEIQLRLFLLYFCLSANVGRAQPCANIGGSS